MRITILEHAGEGDRTLARAPERMLARRGTQLAGDLAAYGHDVHHVTVRAASRRPRIQRADDLRTPSSQGLTFSELTPGRELSVLRALDPDAVVAIGPAAGNGLDLLASGLPCEWVWSPGPTSLVAGDWTPETAAAVILSTQHEQRLLADEVRGNLPSHVIPWRFTTDAPLRRSPADVPLRARLAVAVADPHEGVVDTVRALSLLPEHRLVVAIPARTPAIDHEMRRWLHLAARLGVSSRVRILRVPSPSAMRSLLEGAGLMISVPRRGFQADVVAEAMWCGTPVITSDVEAARDLIETGSTGLVLPPGDPRRLARAVGMVADDPRGRAAWAWNARRRARDLFGEDITSTALLSVLDDLRGGGRSRPTGAVRRAQRANAG